MVEIIVLKDSLKMESTSKEKKKHCNWPVHLYFYMIMARHLSISNIQ